MFTLARTALAVSLACTVMQASALGISQPDVAPRWGQPLDVKVKVTGLPSQDASNDCFQVDVVDGEHAVPQPQVRWELEPASVPSGTDRWLRVRTSTALREPIVTLTVEATCPSRFARTITLLPEIHRPVEVMPTTFAAASQGRSPQDGDARAVPMADPAPQRLTETAPALLAPDALARDEPPAAGSPPHKREQRAASSRPRQPAPPALRKAAIRERATPSGPRLQLSPPTLLAGLPAADFVAGALQAVPAAVVPVSLPKPTVPDPTQLRLQQEVTRLGDVVRAQQEVIRRLETQQSAATPWRLDGPLGLLAGASGLAALLVFLRWRQHRRQQAAWWDTSVLAFLEPEDKPRHA